MRAPPAGHLQNPLAHLVVDQGDRIASAQTASKPIRPIISNASQPFQPVAARATEKLTQQMTLTTAPRVSRRGVHHVSAALTKRFQSPNAGGDNELSLYLIAIDWISVPFKTTRCQTFPSSTGSGWSPVSDPLKGLFTAIGGHSIRSLSAASWSGENDFTRPNQTVPSDSSTRT